MLLLPYIVLLRLSTFLSSKVYTPDADSASLLTLNIFEVLSSPIIQSVIAVICVFFQAVLINRLVIINRLTRHITLFPGAIYALFMSIFPSYTFLSEFLMANTFLILGLTALMKIYNKNFLSVNAFNAGLYFGIATLLAPQYSLLLISGIMIVIMFTAYFNNILQLILGWLTPLFILLQFSYLMNWEVADEFIKFVPSVNTSFFLDAKYKSIEIILFSVLILYSLYLSSSMKLKKSVAARSKVESIFNFMFISVSALLLYPTLMGSQMVVLFIPLAVIIGIELSRMKNYIVVELLYLSLVGLLIYAHYVGLPF